MTAATLTGSLVVSEACTRVTETIEEMTNKKACVFTYKISVVIGYVILRMEQRI